MFAHEKKEQLSENKPIRSYEDDASYISKLFVTWMNPIFRKGYKQDLKETDIGLVANQDKCRVLYEDFLKIWSMEKMNPQEKQSLWRVLWHTVGYRRLTLSLAYYSIYVALSFAPILILNALTRDLEGISILSDTTKWTLVAFLFVIPIVGSVCYSQSNIIMYHIGVQMRNVLINMIYRKSLKLSPSARQAASTGQIVNMFSNDTIQIQRFLSFFNLVILAPPQIAVCLALIYLQIGVATFVGLGLLVALMPLSILLFVVLTWQRTKKVKFTDARVKLINEVLSGIRVIKNYAWEKPLESKITEIRMKELELLKQSAYVIAIGFTLILMSAPILQPVLMFYTYVRLGNQLDAAKAFTSLSLFNLMQFPFTFLPFGIGMYVQSLVSCRRMLNFFMSDELILYVDSSDESMSKDGYAIKITNANLSWLKDESIKDISDPFLKSTTSETTIPYQKINNDSDDENKNGKGKNHKNNVDVTKTSDSTPITNILDDTIHLNRALNTLIDISISVKKGQLVAVVGSVGSGKSSLLSALLGELHLHSGYVRVVGSVAYCDQKPWILNATVKDNILFGRPYDEMKFDQAIHAASMEDDIRVLPGGILTEIGERGINLSGGQKARVALARAVYCNADVYFLDDPLSAVDAHVGQHIFQECIKKTLGDKTRILVTHHVHLLQQCDSIIVLEDGKVKVSGTYDEISNSGIDIDSLLPKKENKVVVVESVSLSIINDSKSMVKKLLESEQENQSISILNTENIKRMNKNINVNDNTTRGRSMSNVSNDSIPTNRQRSTSTTSKISNHSTSPNQQHGRKRASSAASDMIAELYEDIAQAVMPTLASRYTIEHEKEPSRSEKNAIDDMGDVPDLLSHPSKYDDLKSYRISKKSETEYEMDVEAALHSSSTKRKKNEDNCGKSIDDVDNISESKSEVTIVVAKPINDKITYSYTDHSTEQPKFSKLMTIEEKKLGDVEMKTYKYYIYSGGIFLFIWICIFMIVGQGFQIASSFWLANWGTVTVRHENHNDPLSSDQNIMFLNYYAMLSCLFLIAYVIRSILLAEHRLGTSVVLHRDLLNRILGTSITFFDITPLGRILNRFSSDMVVVDEELSQSISQMTSTLFGVLGAVGIIVGSTKGTFLIIFVPMLFVYNRFMKFFRKTNTTLARMESISRSPIYADFSQALVGLNSIRAYHEEDRFINHLESQVDKNSIANMLSQIGSEWLGIRLDILGAIITLFIAVLAITTNGFIPASFLALGLSNSFQVTGLLKFCVRMIATFEAQMNSVERIMYYIDNVEQEGSNKEVSPESIPKDWPSEGAIVGKNLQMRYRDGPLVLKGVSFDIKGHEKIGIAGRTGSGKSSMMIALFRIQELAEGSILIDGIDIATVPLHILRSRLGIIPQDPVMFSATIRFNLDPFNEHTDQDLWSVLESVNMKDHVTSLPNKLVEEVAEGGDNFSAGQRQLICIARALLRHPKILVLDEATASIDNDTDALVQVMVREQFKSSTVLTIAHRLHTIIDSDKIMVLDSGNLAEFDSAENLLAKENGLFKLLWDRHQADHKE